MICDELGRASTDIAGGSYSRIVGADGGLAHRWQAELAQRRGGTLPHSVKADANEGAMLTPTGTPEAARRAA